MGEGLSVGDGLGDVVCVGVGLAVTLGESDPAPDAADFLGDGDLSGEADLLAEAAGDPLRSGDVVGSAAELFDEQAEMAAQASKARRKQQAAASLARNPVLAVGCTFMEPSPCVAIWPPVSDAKVP